MTWQVGLGLSKCAGDLTPQEERFPRGDAKQGLGSRLLDSKVCHVRTPPALWGEPSINSTLYGCAIKFKVDVEQHTEPLDHGS